MRYRLVVLVVVLSLVTVPVSAVVPPPTRVVAQVGSCALAPGPLGVGFKALCEAGQIAVLAGPYVEGVSRPMTGLATKVIAAVVAAAASVAPALSTFSSTGATGDPRMEEYLRRARLNELPPDQQNAIMGLAAADEQAKDYLVYDPVGGLTDGVIAIAAGYVGSDVVAGAYEVFVHQLQLGGVSFELPTAAGWLWINAPAAGFYKFGYHNLPVGAAWWISVPGTGPQSVTWFFPSVPEQGAADPWEYFRIVREDGVIQSDFFATYRDQRLNWTLEGGRNYYLIVDGFNPADQAWTGSWSDYWAGSSAADGALYPVVLASEREYSDYQGETPLPVAIKAGVTGAQVAGTLPSQVANNTTEYTTNNITNIYNEGGGTEGGGGVAPSNWTPELVARQVDAAENTAANSVGLLESIQGIPAAIAGIPQGIQDKLALWTTPTRDVGTSLQGLRDLASTKAPMSWAVEIERVSEEWFQGTGACTTLQMPLGFGEGHIPLVLCPSWIGDWSRPLTAVLIYLVLATYIFHTGRRVLFGGGGGGD